MNIQATGKQFQLINNDGELVKNQEECFEQLKLDSVNKNYYTLGIIGAQSSGKSTLLHIIALLDRPTSGEVFFNNKSF